MRGAPYFAVAVVLLVLVAALFADALTPHNPEGNDLRNTHAEPWFLGGDATNFLGTDRLGRDVLSRLIKGAQLSMIVACSSIGLAALVGSTLGLLAGYYGSWGDILITRLVDLAIAFPSILLALAFAVTVGPSLWVVIVILALVTWGYYARLIRAETLAIKERDFVALAKVAGVSGPKIIITHVLPNVLNSIIVLSTLQVGFVVTIAATLSFLGAGVPPPAPTWGDMIAKDRDFIRTAWWVSGSAGLAIAMTILAFNQIGDWLRDRLDPKLNTL